MQISWLGYSAFRLQENGITILTNPYDQASNFRIHKQAADIVISSQGRKTKGHEAAEAVSGKPMVIASPGEYEIKGVFIYGLPQGDQTIYLLTVDGISVAFLGTVKLKELSQAQLEVMEGADVLIIPVGGGVVTSAKDAAHIINQIEPRIVIPAHYKMTGSKGLDSVDAFLKEYSAPHETIEKLKLHKKDLAHEDTKVVVLKH